MSDKRFVTLKQLINALKKFQQDAIIRKAISNPRLFVAPDALATPSYCLAFESAENVKVSDLLAIVVDLPNKVFTNPSGKEYKYALDDYVVYFSDPNPSSIYKSSSLKKETLDMWKQRYGKTKP